jgi:hypothetical protein
MSTWSGFEGPWRETQDDSLPPFDLAEPGTPHKRGTGTTAGLIMAALGDRPAAQITPGDVEAPRDAYLVKVEFREMRNIAISRTH